MIVRLLTTWHTQ